MPEKLTKSEVVALLRKTADALERSPKMPITGEKPMFGDEDVIGAALVMRYTKELFESAGRESFTKAEVLRCLDLIIEDPEVFPAGIMQAIVDCAGGE